MLRLTNMAFREFRGHRAFDINLGALTVIRGANGSGKTTIRYGAKWVLTSRVMELTDAAGKGAEALLVRGQGTSEGAKKGAVKLVIDGLGDVVREVPNKLKGAGLSGGVKEAEKDLYTALNLPTKAAITLACNPAALANMNPDDLRDLLFSVLTDRMTKDQLLEAINDWLYGYAETTAAVADAAMEWARTTIPERPGGASIITRLYKTAYDARREANGAVRALEQQIAALQNATNAAPPPEGFSIEDIPKVRQRLTGYQAQVTTLQQELWQAQQAARERQTAEQAVQAATSALAELRVKTGIADGDGASGNATSLRAEIQTLAQQVRTAREQTGACPVYAGVMCPLSEEDVQRHITAAEGRRQERITVLAQVVIHDAVQALRHAEAARDAITVPDTTETAQRLTRLQELVEKDTDLLQTLSAASGRKEGADEAASKLKDAETEAAMYAILTKCFDSDGVKVILLEQWMGDLQNRINARLAEILDASWTARVSASADYPILISHPKHKAAPMKTLSTAERILVSVAIQDALNDFHGLGLMMIDDAEKVTGGSHDYLLQVLEAWVRQGKYGTIVVIKADETAPADGIQADILVETPGAVTTRAKVG